MATEDGAPLTTDRLVLEPVTAALAEGVFAASQTSLPELRPWLPWAAKASLESTTEFAERAEEQSSEGVAYHFAVLDDGVIVGGVGLRVDRLFRSGEIGYWLRTDRMGRGYATEAARAVLRFAFGDLGLERLELRAGVGNPRSQRLAERLGFVREGTLREAGVGAGGRYDCYLYGLLARDAG
jgi:RimJ/RimL family protein N-acetyltransferase